MEQPVLSDPKVFPSGKVLAAHLGKAHPTFLSLFDFNHATYPEFAERWKYYNDGMRWLLNVSRKKKTVFWLSVSDGSFLIGFYFASKAEQSILESHIPRKLKDQYAKTSEKKFRGISLVLKTKKDIEVYKELLTIKLQVL